MRRRIKHFIAWGNLAILLLALAVSAFGWLDRLGHALYDFDMSRAASHERHPDIVVVGIDQASLNALGAYPWDRSVYVPLLQRMNQPGEEAKAIAFDIIFDTTSNPKSDQAFANALARYPNVILPVVGNTENDFTRRYTNNLFAARNRMVRATSVTRPIPLFADHAHLAEINRPIDPDGVTRNTWLELQGPHGTVYPSLAVEAARLYGANVDAYLQRNPHEEMPIDFQASTNDYTTVSFASVVNGQVPASFFKGKIVLIGFTAVGLGRDTGPTPLEASMEMVYIHANIIQQILNGAHIRHLNVWSSGLIPLLILLGLGLTWRTRTVAGVVLVFAATALVLAGQFFLFKRTGNSLDTVPPLAGLYASYMYNVAVKSFFDVKHRQFITRQFGRYISPDLVKQIAASEQEIQLGGTKKELSILFLDIRGFTSLSEKMSPEEVVGFLNMMFDMITEKTLANRGTVDKFIGDAAMLLFNAPLDVPDHANCAVKTACDIQAGMASVRKQIQEKYGVTVSVGIGVNTGEAVVGNIGSYLRVDYTAIGDNVNIASRIESGTTANQILISESTYERVKDRFNCEYLEERMMKGKSVGIRIYEVRRKEANEEEKAG